MAKVTLGKRPKSFSRKVEFTMVDGDSAELTVVFKYRTKREFGALIDELVQPAKQAEASNADQPSLIDTDASVPEVKTVQLVEFMTASIEAQADYILKICDGWDIPDAPFDRESVIAFCDEQPAGAKAVMSMYREAITEGRLGN